MFDPSTPGMPMRIDGAFQCDSGRSGDFILQQEPIAPPE
jgi:hypothetical protein